MSRPGFVFSHQLRVRYSEIDGQKIVFNAHYLTYCDIAVTEYFRELRRQYPDTQLETVVAKATLNFRRSAVFDDILNIYCRTKHIGNSSMVMEFHICREGEPDPLLEAEIVYVNINKEYKPTPIPEKTRQNIAAFEQGAR